jgi:hypothetical protein
MTEERSPSVPAGLTLVQRLAQTIGAEMGMRQSPAQIAWAVMRDVEITLNEWADEADDTSDAPFGGSALRWAADEFGRQSAPFGRVGYPAQNEHSGQAQQRGADS